MAAPVVTFINTAGVGSKAVDGESITTQVGSLALNPDIFLHGTNSVSDKVSGATVTAYLLGAAVTGDPFAFQSGGANNGDHIFMITQVGGTVGTLANGGIGIIVANDDVTDSVGIWYVGPQPGYLGGWVYCVINPALAFDAAPTAGTAVWTQTGNPAQLSSVDGLGVQWIVSNTVMGASDNCWLESMSVGTGYRLTNGDAGSTEGKFTDFTAYEETNRFGAIQSLAGVVFPLCKLRIGFASGAGNTEFIDTGFTVTWKGVFGAGGVTSAVASDFYALHVEKGSGTTDVTLSNGTLAASSPAEVYLDFVGSTSVTLTNITTNRARLIDLDGAVSWIGGSIISSGMLDLGGSPTFQSVGFVSPTDVIALKVDTPAELDNVADISFDGAGIGGRGSCAIQLGVGGSYDFDNITFANRVANSTDVLIPFGSEGPHIISVLNNGDTPTVQDDSILDSIMDDWQQFVDSRAQSIAVNSGNRTYTRSAGSFLTDGPDRQGFRAGQTVRFTGFANTGNNGPKMIESVTATVITVQSSTGLVTEGAGGDERAFQYRNGIVETTPFTPVVVNNAVALSISNVVVGSNVAIIADTGGIEAAGTILLNTVAAATTVSVGYNFLGEQPIIVRVRRSQAGGSTRYFPINTGGIIDATGFSLRIEQIVDTIAAT